jgi:glycosyltransferase involved in cell wall biosynthesis
VVKLLSDQAAWSDLARRGYARAAGFTWERCAERTVAAYRKAAAGGPARPGRRDP